MSDVQGYEKVAHLMGRYPEYGIFRRFRELNFRTLLYLQAELVRLETELQKATSADRNSGDAVRQYYGRHWPLLNASLDAGNDAQISVLLEIKARLKEYNQCLRDLRSLADLRRPSRYNISFLRSWFQRKHMGDFPIISSDRHAWDSEHDHDLVVLEPSDVADSVSQWISGALVPYYHRSVGKHHRAAVDWDPTSDIAFYSSSGIHTAVDILATIASCLFPIGATVVLYYLQSMGSRLGALAAFTVVFALCLALLTSAKRVEIFAATTAFAAVQVVFIGTNSANPQNAV